MDWARQPGGAAGEDLDPSRGMLCRGAKAARLRARVTQRFRPPWPASPTERLAETRFDIWALLLPGVLVVATAGDQALKELSRQEDGDFPYQVSSVVLVSSVLSTLVGVFSTCAVLGPREALRLCFDAGRLWSSCLPSALFAYASVLRFAALRYMAAEVLTVMEPTLGLALSALAARLLRRRCYGRQQVAALLMALLGLLGFLALEVQDLRLRAGGSDAAELLSQRHRLGWLFVFGSAVLGTAAGVVGERLLKEGAPAAAGGEWPAFLVLKTQMELPALVAAAVSFAVGGVLGGGPHRQAISPDASTAAGLWHLVFHGWNRCTLGVAVATVLRSWLAAGIVKYLDVLCYSVAQVLAMLLIFVELELFVPLLGPATPHAREVRAVGLLARVRRRLGCYVMMALVTAFIAFFSLSPPAPTGHSGDQLRATLSEPLLRRRRPVAGSGAGWAWRRLARRAARVAAWVGRCGWACWGHCGRVLLLSAYVAADTGKMFLVGWAKHGRAPQEAFLPSSVILVQLIVSCSMALAITGAQVGTLGVKVALDPRNIARCVPVAAFFFTSKACTVAALGFVDAGTVKLSTQLILPCTAVLSVWMFEGRVYSRDQWLSIVTICMGTLAFHAVQNQAEAAPAGAVASPLLASRREARAAGLTLCAVVIVANSVGSVVGERFLKGASGMPLACLKAQLVSAELLVVVLVLAGVEGPRSGRGWFDGWDWRVVVCSLGWVPSTWMSTIITARFSTVVKNVVQCISTMLTYFLALAGAAADGGGALSAPAATPAALVVVLTVITLALQSSPTSQEDKSAEDEFVADAPLGEASRGLGHLGPITSWPSRRSLRVRQRTRFLPRMDSILDIATSVELDSEPVSRAGSKWDLEEILAFERSSTV